jgi:hypothetical protein
MLENDVVVCGVWCVSHCKTREETYKIDVAHVLTKANKCCSQQHKHETVHESLPLPVPCVMIVFMFCVLCFVLRDNDFNMLFIIVYYCLLLFIIVCSLVAGVAGVAGVVVMCIFHKLMSHM